MGTKAQLTKYFFILCLRPVGKFFCKEPDFVLKPVCLTHPFTVQAKSPCDKICICIISFIT